MISPSFAQKLHDVVGTWGRPPDDPARVAAGLCLVALLFMVTGRGRSILGLGDTPLPRRLFLWVTGFTAALLSIFYIAHYLRGGPRIIDATTYFLQGRALSHGDFSWTVGEPSASFRGRFLVDREVAGGEGVMGGIFPPGYPLLLALGFGMGAPMVVGPALAAALVVATYRLTRTLATEALVVSTGAGARVSRTAAASEGLVEAVARTAALLSVVCGALRYHTADTMSHGATALGIALALDAALRRRAGICGLVLGAVVATRPVSALPIALVAMVVLLHKPNAGTRAVLTKLALGALPGVLLLLLAQHSVTGAWLTSSQRMYYATSDGPPGCWGLGWQAGCLYEHGEFVRARLANGFGLASAAGATLRRLRMHLLDVANLEPLAVLVLVPLAKARGLARRSPAVVASLAVIGLHVLAYAAFYFDGNYPGGGARLFADVLPIEHALLALAVARLAAAPTRYVRGAWALVGAALAGFAIHGAFEHEKLADRDGGRPMFEPDLLARANVTTGLVFVDTDHGFALGHDPSARIKNGIVVARLRNDDRDRLLFDRLDHPPTYLYKLDFPGAASPAAGALPGMPPQATAALVPWAPAALGDTLRFEAEAEWPVLEQRDGFAVPIFTEACASGARALLLTPSPLDGRATAVVTVPILQPGRYTVSLRIVQGATLPFATTRGAGPARGAIQLDKERWDWVEGAGAACVDLAPRDVDLSPPNARFVLEAQLGAVALDKVSIRRLP